MTSRRAAANVWRLVAPSLSGSPLHITLIQPPTVSTPSTMVQEAVPPIGLAYVAAAVRDGGHELTMIDAVGLALDRFSIWSEKSRIMLRGLDFDSIIARIPEHTDVIGISCMFSNAWRPTRELVAKIRLARPNALIVLGGEHATACHEYILATCPEVDYCVLGEGEATFCLLLEHRKSGTDPSLLTGVASRTNQGEGRPLELIAPTLRRTRIRDIANISEPAWDLFPIEQYVGKGFNHGVQRGRTMPILASRGCPYQCSFCSSPNMWTTRWMARTPESVVSEMKQYIERYQVNDFAFYDLTAIVQREWILDFCNLLIAERMNVTWQLPSGTRSEAIDREVSRLLYRSGCRNISYAPESGAPSVLRRIKKRVNLDRMMDSIRIAISEGIEVKVNIILGFPDETFAEVRESYAFLARLAKIGVEAASIFPFCPYPGSEIFQTLANRGALRLEDDYFDTLVFTDYGRLVSYNERFGTNELRALVLGGLAAFYGAQLFTNPMRVADMALQLVRNEQGSKVANAILPQRARKRAWQTLTRQASES